MCEVCQGEDKRPCCEFIGVCCAAKTNNRLSMCIHCGAEMEKDEIGIWRHHSQMQLPLNERWTMHDSEY